jgi:beta-glucosidase
LSEPARADTGTYRFPPGFLWGTSTSAHQVEGDNRWSDWWEYEQQGRVPHRSGDACRHYQLFERDFDLCRSLGQNAHRLSIEWSRIEPAEGRWSPEALAHYAEVVRALAARGLEPIVTLHHFTNPAWFLRRGGWTRADSPALFERYVEHVAGRLTSTVRYWLTVNEPTVYAMQGYVLGEWPPCLTGAWRRAALVLRNLARAHVAAYRVLHQHRPDVRVGFAHSAPLIQPCNPASVRDRLAAAVRNALLNRAFFQLIGARRRPARNIDVIGLNYHTRMVVHGTRWGLGALVGRVCRTPHHGDDGPRSGMGWEVFPAGLSATLEAFSGYGVPLIVTENGIATDDEALRCRFLLRHLASLGDALEKGVNVTGYLYWSLIDNFEWALGTTARFGMASVDPVTEERVLRPCARVFERVCRDNAVPRETAGPEAAPGQQAAAGTRTGGGVGTSRRDRDL